MNRGENFFAFSNFLLAILEEFIYNLPMQAKRNPTILNPQQRNINMATGQQTTEKDNRKRQQKKTTEKETKK